MSSRRRPLHTSGIVILSIAHIAHTRSQDFRGPIGSMNRKLSRMAEFASPLVYALQYQLLAILSFGDDLILAFEKRVETIFPPSKYVFYTTDKLIEITETFPAKFDDAIREFPVIIHQYPLLHWLVNQVISWLNYWISMLMHWEFGHAKEKEIKVDTNSKERNFESPSEKQTAESSPHKWPQSSESDTENVDVMAKKEMLKGSYKEVLLEKGKGDEGKMQVTSSKEKEEEQKEKMAKKDEGKMQDTRKQDVCMDEYGNGEVASDSKSYDMMANKEVMKGSYKEILLDKGKGGGKGDEGKMQETSGSKEKEEDKENIAKKDDMMSNKEVIKGSYKEMLLDKGKGEAKCRRLVAAKKRGRKKENMAKKDEGKMKETRRQDVCVYEDGNGEEVSTSKSDEITTKHDQILELFESGWLMTPPKECKKPAWLSPSASYTK